MVHVVPISSVAFAPFGDVLGPSPAGDRASVTDIGTEVSEPFHACLTERTSRAVGMPTYDAHGRSFGSEAPHEALAEEPRSAKYADCGHRPGPSRWIRFSSNADSTSH